MRFFFLEGRDDGGSDDHDDKRKADEKVSQMMCSLGKAAALEERFLLSR